MGFAMVKNRTPVRYRNQKMLEPTGAMSGEFDEEILADLIAQNFSGIELLRKFKELRREIRPAVEKMLAEADAVAYGIGEYGTYSDIFGTGNKNV